MEQHVHGRRAPLPPSCAGLEPLLDRLMAPDRDARFADAACASAAIRTAVEGLTQIEVPMAAAGAA
jgi:hypothetical protein